MKKKLANMMMMADMVAAGVPCDVPDMEQKGAMKTKAESKKCKSCKFFNECRKTRLMRPMDVACEKYVKRKK